MKLPVQTINENTEFCLSWNKTTLKKNSIYIRNNRRKRPHFCKSVCSFLKTGNSNVRDITHKFGLFYLTTLGSDKLLSNCTNTSYKKKEIFSQESLKPSSMNPRKTEQSLYLDHREMTCKHSMHSWNSGTGSYTPLAQILKTYLISAELKIYFQSHHWCTYTGNFLLSKIHTKCSYPEEVTRKMSNTETCQAKSCLGRNLLAQMTREEFPRKFWPWTLFLIN